MQVYVHSAQCAHVRAYGYASMCMRSGCVCSMCTCAGARSARLHGRWGRQIVVGGGRDIIDGSCEASIGERGHPTKSPMPAPHVSPLSVITGQTMVASCSKPRRHAGEIAIGEKTAKPRTFVSVRWSRPWKFADRASNVKNLHAMTSHAQPSNNHPLLAYTTPLLLHWGS